MRPSPSIVERVARGSALAASSSALLVAVVTTALSSYLVGVAEDRRLADAAVTFAEELDHDGVDLDAVREVHRDESEEMDHTGMSFAVYDDEGLLVVGDARVLLADGRGCRTSPAGTLRICRARSTRGFWAVVGAAHPSVLPILSGAAVLSAVVAAVLASLASRPLSRRVVAPLTGLRERIAGLSVEELSGTSLGESDGIAEVDALRDTLGQLIVRMDRALELSHRFAANAAHELRTPLASVRAELELLAERIERPELRADADRAERKLAELSVLVERLSVLSMPARARSDADEVVSVRDLLEDALGLVARDRLARASIVDGDALVRGDSALLATMIANVLDNATKFGRFVSVSLAVVADEVVLDVDDDGPGIPSPDRERVFEPFFRAPDAHRRRIPGHGLGLALVRHIARTHGGEALFVDEPESRARLRIRLPLA